MEELRFAGTPGTPVPPVDPDDVKAVWTIYQESEKKHPGQQFALGAEFINVTCKPGTNVAAVWYRVAMLHVLVRHSGDRLASHIRDGQPAPELFRAVARTPMLWVGETEHEGLPFDMEDLLRRLRSPE